MVRAELAVSKGELGLKMFDERGNPVGTKGKP